MLGSKLVVTWILGIAFVALRHRSLYRAQVATKYESPAHAATIPPPPAVRSIRVKDRFCTER